MTPQIGALVVVRGLTCRVFKIYPLGTVDVVSLCGNFAYRVTGLVNATWTAVEGKRE